MMTEAIRVYLVRSGIKEAEKWSHEQIMNHLDRLFALFADLEPVAFEAIISTFWKSIAAILMTVNEVLHKDLPNP